MTKQSDREFFEQRVFRPDTPCWNWRAYINRKGYGTWRRNGINTYVHRVAYELFVGKIPEGMEIHHTCCNRSCVNPEHLQLVTHTENIRLIARTHCPHGHPYDEVNSYIRPSNGQRVCRTCLREHSRERKRKLAGENFGRLDRECKNGHPRTPESTYVSNGRRRCRICRLEQKRKPGGYKDPNRQRATHCPHGHEYTPENTYTYKNGSRYCRTCNRKAARKR